MLNDFKTLIDLGGFAVTCGAFLWLLFKTLPSIQAEHIAAVKSLADKHAADITVLTECHRLDIERLTQSFSATVDRLTDAYQREAAATREQHRETMNVLTDALSQRATP